MVKDGEPLKAPRGGFCRHADAGDRASGGRKKRQSSQGAPSTKEGMVSGARAQVIKSQSWLNGRGGKIIHFGADKGYILTTRDVEDYTAKLFVFRPVRNTLRGKET
jgi:hypothetical protein